MVQFHDTSQGCDVFLSYRWGEHDSRFVSLIYDGLLDCDFRYVFHDDHVMEVGNNLRATFAEALLSSKVFVAFCSHDALTKMQLHDPQEVDCVLLEWILALEAQKKGTLIILPIPYGSVSEGSPFLDFNYQLVGSLPKIYPMKTVEKAMSLMKSSPSPELPTLTVRDVVTNILGFIYSFHASEFTSLKDCIPSCIRSIQVVHTISIQDKPSPIASMTANEAKDFDKAWSILNNPALIKNKENAAMLRQLLEELGATRSLDLDECDDTEIYEMANALKETPKYKFLKALGKQQPDGLDETLISLTARMGTEDEEFQRRIRDACQQKSTKWNRSKIMIVGEGRAGKTALANSIIGKPFEFTASTIGINQLSCSINYADISNGQWGLCDRPTKELETAIAMSIQEEILKAILIKKLMTTSTETQTIVTVDEKTSPISNDQLVTAPTVVAEPKVENIDNDYVAKQLAGNIQTSSDLIISLFDFGGQSVFDAIHHLFLTPYGVYIIVFNMTWLSDRATKEDKETCISRLKGWVNSILMHTSESSDSDPSNNQVNKSAPIVFVGTHKDQVHDRISIEVISEILINVFGSLRLCWDSVIQNEIERLCFFPVNNVEGRNEGIFPNMLQSIEDRIKKQDYVTQERPLIWLQALDALKADKTKMYYTNTEAYSILANCGISESGFSEVLSFFNRMGELLWNDEDGLRDTIIMDPISFFVIPATRVICKHVKSVERGESVNHVNDILLRCESKFPHYWKKMVSSGVVMNELLVALIGDNHECIINFMVKFGLLVKIRSENQGTGTQVFTNATLSFIVPSLLPTSDDGIPQETFPNFLSLTEELQNSFLISFGLSQNLFDLNSQNILTKDRLQAERFMPNGLFFRFLVKLLDWSQLSTVRINILSDQLFKNNVTIIFGNRKFHLRLLEDLNSICVTIKQCKNYAALLHRLTSILSNAIRECFGSLSYDVMFPWIIDAERWYAIPYESLKRSHTHGEDLFTPYEFTLESSIISNQYCQWLDLHNTDKCDVFLSYRWGDPDKKFVSLIYDSLLDFDFNFVFFDDKVIQLGENLQEAFTKALTSTKVFVPLFSHDALVKMKTHNPKEVDNVLLEWILALQCQKNGNLCILPLPYGSIDEASGFKNFDRNELSSLSNVSPTATLQKAKELLEKFGICNNLLFENEVPTITIIAEKMLVFLYYLDMTKFDNDLKQCVQHCAQTIQHTYRSHQRNHPPPCAHPNFLELHLARVYPAELDIQSTIDHFGQPPPQTDVVKSGNQVTVISKHSKKPERNIQKKSQQTEILL